jgi:hypothetical protein
MTPLAKIAYHLLVNPVVITDEEDIMVCKPQTSVREVNGLGFGHRINEPLVYFRGDDSLVISISTPLTAKFNKYMYDTVINKLR